MGARGDQAVVWSRRIDAYNSTVGLALHRPGTPGFSVGTISDPQPPPQSRGDGITTGQNYDPAVAIAPSGELTAVWAWSPGMRAIVIPPGASTGTRVTLGIDNTTTSYPGVGYDGAGNVTAFWRSPDDTLMTAYRPAGGQFAPARAIPNPDGNAPGHPQYAVAENGDAFATWTNGFNVFVSIRKAGQSSFGAPQTLSDKESPAPHIATDPKGDAVVAWVDRPDPYSNGTVEASYRPAGGQFGSAVPLGQVFFTGTFQAFPAMSRNGEATVAWLGNVLDPAFDAQITAITRSPSGTWGPYEQVSNQDGGDTYANAYDGQGNTYALWTHDRAYAAFRPAGQRFSGAETPLSEQAADGAGPVDATIAASPIDTGAIAAWEFGRSPGEPKNRVEA